MTTVRAIRITLRPGHDPLSETVSCDPWLLDEVRIYKATGTVTAYAATEHEALELARSAEADAANAGLALDLERVAPHGNDIFAKTGVEVPG